MKYYSQQRLPTHVYTQPETYGLSRLPVDQASTLIPDAYTADDFFALEQEKIFATAWVAVGCLQQVQNPGDILVTEVAGRSILVMRDKIGKLGAFYNVCRHRGSKLLEKSCNIKSLHCPYHAWVYGLDGQCLGTSMFRSEKIVDTVNSNGVETDLSDKALFDKQNYGLLPLSVQTWGFLVFVNLSTQTTPFEEWLGDIPLKFQSHVLENWEISGEKIYDVASNYKLIEENFMEYYHLPFVHPELTNVSRMEDHHRCQGKGMYAGMLTTPVSRDVDSVWLNLPAAQSLDKQHLEAAYHICIFPNVTITILPNHAFCMITDPIRANQTRERTFLLTPPGTLDNESYTSMLLELVKFWDMINTQDLSIVERVQLGLSNTAFTGGRMCHKFEEPLHRYQNWVADRMCGIHRIPPGDNDARI